MSSGFDLSRLFAVEGPKLRRFLRRFGPSIWADDIAQIRLRSWRRPSPARCLHRAFLFRVARNLAADAVRRRDASPVRPVENLEDLRPASAAPSPEEALIAAEERQALRAAIASLSEEQRTALVMRKVEGLPPHLIAERLGVSVRHVQRLIAEAIAIAQAHVRAASEDKPRGEG